MTSDNNGLELDALLSAAKAETGLDDFGEPDVRAPLSILIKSLNEEAHLTPAGVMGQRGTLLRTLVNRLRIQDTLKKHPEIRNEKIRGPIVIVGLPRSGTTKLQRVLSSDPGFQKLPLWKIMNPAPFPGWSGDGEDPRIAVAEQFVAAMRTQFPKFYAAHPMSAREPDEEVFLMLLTFLSSIPMHGTRTPSYKTWMVAQDCTGWYRTLRLLLQFIQWQDGSQNKPWVIKAPWHFRWIQLLLETFPDAVVVHCYRDPQQTVPSMAALFEESRKMASDLDHPVEIGALVTDYWSDAVRSFIRQRDELKAEHRFVDVQYTDIVADAPAVIRRIYAAAGLPLTDEALAQMQSWEAANPQHGHGRHHYTLERYGFSEESIAESFGAYVKRFGR